MAKYSIDELEVLLDVKRGSIRAWKSKGKIIFNEHGELDTTVPENNKWFQRKMDEKEGIIEKAQTPTTGFKKTKKAAQKTKTVSKPKGKEVVSREVLRPEKTEYQKKKEELELKKLQRDVELKEAELAKRRGNFVDADKALEVMNRWSTSKDDHLMVLLEKRIRYICDREGVPADRSTRYIKEIPKMINEAAKESLKEMKEAFKDE